jgi:uncharacterized protein (DUF1499 family)
VAGKGMKNKERREKRRGQTARALFFVDQLLRQVEVVFERILSSLWVRDISRVRDCRLHHSSRRADRVDAKLQVVHI